MQWTLWKTRIDGSCTKTYQAREMMDFPNVTGFYNDPYFTP